MVFSSPVFLFVFFTSVFILYRCIPTITAKNILLLVFSLAFYTYGEPKAVILMIISVVMNYLFGLAMKKENAARKQTLALAITADLLMLGAFKYAAFGAELLYRLPFVSVPIPSIALPIGISFYTFQAMSYVIDAYRDPKSIQKNPYKLALYITFFPQLVAGPIVKYSDFSSQINNRSCTAERTAGGMKRFSFGLAKKLLIANTMAIAADKVYSLGIDDITLPLAWLGAVSYMIQIYFDFSAYSDMAIGLGAMFGFEFRENFDHPYVSSSMREFWSRWHISLSSWFRDYLYIPLGGSRCSKARTALNRMIVFFCTGLWHGAGLNFIVWGLLNGVLVTLEGKGTINPDKAPKPVGRVYTLMTTLIAFVFFRANTPEYAVRFIGKLFNPVMSQEGTAVFFSLITPMYLIMLAAAVIFAMPVVKTVKSKLKPGRLSSAAEACSFALSLAVLAVCILTLSSSAYNPFIYFRF